MVQDGARWCKVVQYHAIPCNTMQNHAIPCNTMPYHASLITADGAYHCPVGSIMAIFSSVRSSYSHPDLLVIHPPTTPLFQITPVLNTGLSLSEPLQLYKGKTWQDSGILWYTLAYSGILWHTLAYSGILWHTLTYSGILWQTLAYSSILWHTLA